MNFDSNNTVATFDGTKSGGKTTSWIVGGVALTAVGVLTCSVLAIRAKREEARNRRREAEEALAAVEQMLDQIAARSSEPDLEDDDDQPEASYQALNLNLQDRMDAAIAKMLRRTNYSARAVAFAKAAETGGHATNSEMRDIIVEASTFEI